MKRTAFLIFVTLSLFCVNPKAQKAPVTYPSIQIDNSVDKNILGPFAEMSMPEDMVCSSTVIIFTAKITGLDSKIKPTFNWKTTSGKILSGQGTSTIKVETHSEDVQATVELVGLPKKFSRNPPVRASSKIIRVGNCELIVDSFCPSIAITTSDSVVSLDKDFTAVARINYLDSENNMTHEWTVTDGIILEGQGTLAIKAKCAGLENCVVGFKIKGFAPECQSEAKATVDVWATASPRKIDSYGDLTFDDEKQHLDSFAVELKRKESAQGYIVVYSKSEVITEDITRRVNETRFYLTGDLRINVDKVKVIYGGYRETFMTELWITPPGIKPPLQQSK